MEQVVLKVDFGPIPQLWYLAMSEVNSGCYNWGDELYWHLMETDQGYTQHLTMHRMTPPSYPTQTVNSAEAEKPVLQYKESQIEKIPPKYVAQQLLSLFTFYFGSVIDSKAKIENYFSMTCHLKTQQAL